MGRIPTNLVSILPITLLFSSLFISSGADHASPPPPVGHCRSTDCSANRHSRCEPQGLREGYNKQSPGPGSPWTPPPLCIRRSTQCYNSRNYVFINTFLVRSVSCGVYLIRMTPICRETSTRCAPNPLTLTLARCADGLSVRTHAYTQQSEQSEHPILCARNRMLISRGYAHASQVYCPTQPGVDRTTSARIVDKQNYHLMLPEGMLDYLVCMEWLECQCGLNLLH